MNHPPLTQLTFHLQNMKIIRVIALDPVLRLEFHPDSALVLQGRPLFMPEEGEGWQAQICLAVKISRLGKNISEKFAPRYYDGISFAMRLTLPSAPELASVIAGMDSGIVHGQWLDAAKASAPMAVAAGGAEIRLAPQAAVIDRAISMISRYTTLKIGDMILLPAADTMVPLAAPGRFDITVDGVDILSQKLV